jgi:hypothetical protein
MSAEDGRSLRFVLPVLFSFAVGMYAGFALSGCLRCDLAWEESLRRYEKALALEMESARKQEEMRKLPDNLSSHLFKHEKGVDAERTHLEVRGNSQGSNHAKRFN